MYERDPALFHVPKDHMKGDQYHRQLKATAILLHVDKVLDIKHIPIDLDEIELFEKYLNFMCSVFERTLLTNQGESIVMADETDYNTQSAYEKNE